ncbi:uracil-DNA glycosylase family protein [Streptococcus ictaluri]|nr:uracil-DNA glycosylase family protein [Streptococcus ictaluri]
MDAICQAIMSDPDNQYYTKKGIKPLYTAPETAKILVVGQAPGIVAQETGLYWNDRSGVRLREWLGVDDKTFYNSGLFGILPMDFYYPGKGKAGDLPPRKAFAAKWHPPLLAKMPQLELTILVGWYAQRYYLMDQSYKNLTETVHHFQDYLPNVFPLVHPSPRTQIWLAKNPWFERELLPHLHKRVAGIIQK